MELSKYYFLMLCYTFDGKVGKVVLLPEAIKLRIIELLDEKNMSAYKLSYKGGFSPSNISDVLRGKVTEPTVTTILHICEGANISLKDFFDSKLFDEVEAVEKNRKEFKKKL